MYKYKNLQAGQLPQGHLSLLQNFLNFIMTKYLKQDISGELNICVDECSPFVFSITGDEGLSMSHDEKVMMFYSSGEVPYQLLLWSCF